MLAYAKPTNINVVGSFARRTALLLDSKVTIDMAVTMPLVSKLVIYCCHGFLNTAVASVPTQGLPRLSLLPEKGVLLGMPRRWDSEGRNTVPRYLVRASRR